MPDDPDPARFFELFENAPLREPREILARHGFVPVRPEGLDGRQLRGRLWELLHALAALRFFFSDTDHLDDADLYTWLHDEWLGEVTEDIPPEAEMNCHASPLDPQDDEGTMLWLRYYASPADRADFASEFPNDPLPPRRIPPHDRDRFLPQAYPPPLDPDFEPDDDPLGLKAIDREIRESRELPETGDWKRPAERLRQCGYMPFPPAEITPETLPALLWELLHELSCQGFFVLHTDHLSDAELYSELWRQGIRDEAMLPADPARGAWIHDFTGSGSDEDNRTHLRYYAGAKERARHAAEWPDDPMPPRETPPHARDWRLPKSPFG